MRSPWLLGGLALALAAAALVLSIIALVIQPGSANPEEKVELHPADRSGYAVNLVQQAINFYKENGLDATLTYYNSPESVGGPWYVFIYDENNVRIAHPTRPDLLGKPVDGPSGVDANGYVYGPVIAATTEQGQWVDYAFLNPATGNQEYKHSWFIRHDGLLFGSGWYQILPTSPIAATKADPAEYTIAVVDRAIRYYKAHGRDGTVAYYNTPESVDGPWYVFIVDENRKLIANRDQSLVGRDVSELGNDVNGQNLGEIEVPEGGRWVDYVFANPATGEEGVKHSWAVLHDGVIIGSGWYE